MAGYHGRSKSNNAIAAEAEGRYPATECARRLGVSPEAVRAVLAPCEWHHTSGWYNATDYYDIGDLSADVLARLHAHKPTRAVAETFRADVVWIEWSGSRNHPHATERRASNILVTAKGQFYTFHLPGGDLRKKITGKGTLVKRLCDAPADGC